MTSFLAKPKKEHAITIPVAKEVCMLSLSAKGKRHAHVLRDIRGIVEIDPEWRVSNFGETPYKRADTKRQLR